MARQQLGTAPANSPDAATKGYVDSGDASRAPIASPAFTGTPTAPTPANNTNTTQVATTAFVVSRTPTITVSTTAPSSPNVGDIWIDTN